MATSEDEIRRRERSGQRSHSYFPAANQYAGAPAYIQQAAMRNLAAGAAPMANYNRLQGIQTFGYQRDPKAQNTAIAQSMARTPANQAMQTYQLPSGGTVSAPAGSAGTTGYSKFNPLATQDYAANKAIGYGATPPTTIQAPGGPYSVSGGVAAPITPPSFFSGVSDLFKGTRTALAGIGGALGQSMANLGNYLPNLGGAGGSSPGFSMTGPPPFGFGKYNFDSGASKPAMPQAQNYPSYSQPRRYFDT